VVRQDGAIVDCLCYAVNMSVTKFINRTRQPGIVSNFQAQAGNGHEHRRQEIRHQLTTIGLSFHLAPQPLKLPVLFPQECLARSLKEHGISSAQYT